MFVRSRGPVRRANRLGDNPLDYLRNALPSWAGGMQITPNQAENIATDVASIAPGLKCDSPQWKQFLATAKARGITNVPQCIDSDGNWVQQTAQQILDYSQKNPATLPGDSTSPWAWLTSNAGGKGMPNWGLIGFGTIALWGAGIIGGGWLLSKWLESKKAN